MSETGERLDPTTSDDPAIEMAIGERDWYRVASFRSNFANVSSQVVLLLAGAGTTVAASIAAPVWITSPLAAAVFVLTGARAVFSWNRLAVSRTLAHHDLRVAIHQYQLIDADSRTNEDRRRLVERIHEITAAEQYAWANWRRQIDSAQGHARSGRDLST